MFKFLRNKKISSIFIVFSYVVSSLLVSISVSNIVHLKKIALEETNGLSSNALEVQLGLNKKLNQPIEFFFQENFKDFYVRFKPEIISLDENIDSEIILEYFDGENNGGYIIKEGRELKNKDIIEKNKVVLIGTDLMGKVIEKDGKSYVDINSELYEVVGKLEEGKAGYFKNKIIMPLPVAPKFLKNKFNGEVPIEFLIDNKKNNLIEECKTLKLKLDKDGGSIKYNELEFAKNVVVDSFSNLDVLGMSVLIFFISILNIINISIFWFDDIKKEMGIRKAFGGKNLFLTKIIIKELFLLCILGFIIALIIQFILKYFIGVNFDDISLDLSIMNLIMGIVISFISSLFASIIPVYKLIKLEVIKTIKG